MYLIIILSPKTKIKVRFDDFLKSKSGRQLV